MENHLTLTELRKKAWDALRGNWVTAVISNLIFGILLGIVPMVTNFSLQRETIFSSLLTDGEFSRGALANGDLPYEFQRYLSTMNFYNLINFVVGLLITGALTYGLTKIFLLIKREKNATIETIFDGFKKYKQTFLVNLLLCIFRFLWGLLWGIGFFIVGIFLIFSGAMAIVNGGSGSSGFAILFCILVMLALGISYAIFINRYSMTYFITLDNENIGCMEALEQSVKIMKGNQIRYFLLQLSFIGWFILGLIPCGLGLLWVMPYIRTAEAAFYDDLVGIDENNFDFRLVE